MPQSTSQPEDDHLVVSEDLRIPLADITLSDVRAQGPGGQHGDKASTAVRLQFDAARCAAVDAELLARICAASDQRISDRGVVSLKAQEHRSRVQNRKAALRRLVELLQSVLYAPPTRVPTRPGRAAKQRRREQKSRRSETKALRRRVDED